MIRVKLLQHMSRLSFISSIIKCNLLFVGDQLFTDVWGAKKCGIVTYLTRPIHPKEEIQIVLKRYLEKIVLFFYHRECRRKGK